MALFAERLPVVHIPEQSMIATMRKHMIHHRGGRQLPVGMAGDAQRMPTQVGSPCLAPLAVIPAISSSAAESIATF